MKTNKGFSMVELIIVIAIMAILAGALAPALIKYINKSRISTDVQTGNTIATAIQTALSNEIAYDSAAASYNTQWKALSGGSAWSTSDAFITSVASTVGGSNMPKVKSKKCVAKTAGSTGGNFEYYIDLSSNTVKVRIGGGHLVFPTADECLTNGEATNDSPTAGSTTSSSGGGN